MKKKQVQRILTTVMILGLSLSTTGCFKPSQKAVINSKYYQQLKEENEKISGQLKSERKKTASLEKKIKAIHATYGDRKLAEYKSKVKGSTIVKMSFVSKSVKHQSFAVTNTPVCQYAKDIIMGCYRIIGMTPGDLEKQYKKQMYSYALIDEDNTTYEFKVYGNCYIVFDDIPENVYVYNDASVIGEGLVDAPVQKKYLNFVDRMADAQIIVSDTQLHLNHAAIEVSRILATMTDNYIDRAKYDTKDWKEYRFYTYGTMTKLLYSDQKVICIEDKKGAQNFYKISDKDFKKLRKILK